MVNQQTVNCEHVWREISNYVDGEVDPMLRAAMDEHFRTCTRCASVLAGTQNVVRLYGDERMIEVPAGYGRRLEKRLAQTLRVGKRWSSWSAWLVPVAALALFVGGLRLTTSISHQRQLRSQMEQAAKNIPPDMVVVAATDTKIFHVSGCPFIHNKDAVKTMTAKEALKEGYAPCTRCLRKYLETAGNPVKDSDWTEREVVEAGELHMEER
jgi:methylphosphotriester-DNA--protein-cysteine methyltransferase